MLDIRERESWANRSAERNNPQASMAMGSNDFSFWAQDDCVTCHRRSGGRGGIRFLKKQALNPLGKRELILFWNQFEGF